MSAEFALGLRSNAGTVRLAAANSSEVVTVRVQVADAWDSIVMELSPTSVISDVRREALAHLTGDGSDAHAYEMKYRGVLVNENSTVREAAIANGATLLVVSKRKRPVR